MADAVTPAEGGSKRARRPAARGRFLLVYGLVGLLVGGALGAFAVLVARPGPAPPPQWSTWRPSAAGLEGARQIADFVAARYRLPSGTQLVGVQARPPALQDIPITAIAIRKQTLTGLDASILRGKGGIEYLLCGFGRTCSIAEGTPSRRRERLLRREVLELSLYTLKYVDGVDSVIALLPPPPNSDPIWALFFQRSDLQAELERPLRATLPRRVSTADDIDSVEARAIDLLTEPRRFRFQFQRLQDGSVVLVLDPPDLAVSG